MLHNAAQVFSPLAAQDKDVLLEPIEAEHDLYTCDHHVMIL